MFYQFGHMWIIAIPVMMIVWVALVGACVYLAARMVARNAGGGWGRLLSRFAASDRPPAGCRLAEGRTIQVGKVIARRCATIGVGPRGLYLAVPWHNPTLIPWSEILAVSPTRLYWQEAFSLEVGEPLAARVTVSREDFEAIRPYLGQGERWCPQPDASPVPEYWKTATPAA